MTLLEQVKKMKIKRKANQFFLLLSILTTVFLSGCWDVKQTERMIYIHSIGLDYKDGKYIAYLQIINLGLLAKSEAGGSNNQVTAELGHASGNTVEEAIFNIYQTTQRRLFWGHIAYIVFTENVLKQGGLQAITDILDRYVETYYQIWIYLTEDSIPNILHAMPNIGMSTDLSRLSDPEPSFKQFSYIRPIDLRRLIILNNRPPNEIVLPSISGNHQLWEADSKHMDAAILNGLGIITNDNLKGYLSNSKAKGYRWMNKDFQRSEITIKGKEGMGLLLRNLHVKVTPVIKHNEVKFNVKIKAKVHLNKVRRTNSLEEISSEAKRKIKKEIMDTYLEGLKLDSDIYRLSNVLYIKNYSTWKRIQHDGKIPLNNHSINNIDINLKIIDAGKKRNKPTLIKRKYPSHP